MVIQRKFAKSVIKLAMIAKTTVMMVTTNIVKGVLMTTLTVLRAHQNALNIVTREFSHIQLSPTMSMFVVNVMHHANPA